MLFKCTPSRLQRAIQLVFTGLCLYIGWRFFLFCLWAQSGAGAPVAKPSGVEGLLPISALLGLKYFVLTGRYDPAHPAGLTIFLFAILTGAFLRRGFCAFICPVGLISNAVSAAGRKLGLERMAPRKANAIAHILKYVLMSFFVLTVAFSMSGPALKSFLLSNYNLTADAHLLRFFLNPSRTALVVLGALLAVNLVFRNAWCRWMCPYGALLGLFAWAGITQITRSPDACVNCLRCQRACPAHIPIHQKTTVRTPECLGCARCVDSCSTRKALRVTLLGRSVHWAFPGFATLGAFAAMWLAARLTGHWDSSLPLMMLKTLYAGALN